MSQFKEKPAHLWTTLDLSPGTGMEEVGTKHDADKVDLSLISRVSLEQEARALQFGEKKYGRYNYTKGFEASRLVAACLRHVTAWNDGEDLDPESGLHHLGHAKACLGMLLHIEQLGTLTDNRMPKKETK